MFVIYFLLDHLFIAAALARADLTSGDSLDRAALPPALAFSAM